MNSETVNRGNSGMFFTVKYFDIFGLNESFWEVFTRSWNSSEQITVGGMNSYQHLPLNYPARPYSYSFCGRGDIENCTDRVFSPLRVSPECPDPGKQWMESNTAHLPSLLLLADKEQCLSAGRWDTGMPSTSFPVLNYCHLASWK